MAQFFDISKKITNELPTLKITDDITVTVNNRKSNVMAVQLLSIEREKKEKAGKTVNDEDFMNEALKLLIGERNAALIEEMDYPLPEYTEIFQAIMGVATGTFGETPTK